MSFLVDIHWKLHYMIILGKSQSDPIYQILAISNLLLVNNISFPVIWDLVNLGQFDRINQMKTLSVIKLNSFHSNFKMAQMEFS
jgi:hypothetical protein